MTLETEEVDLFLARKAEEQRDRDFKLLCDIVIYTGLTIAVLSLLEIMLKTG